MHSTTILPVPEPDTLGAFRPAAEKASSTPSAYTSRLDHWDPAADEAVAPGLPALRQAADAIRNTDIPVGFPTETVYGLGADATRSAAVKGIFAAKGRPSDNPLIVHVCDLTMLRGLLGPGPHTTPTGKEALPDLPAIYRPLVERFWPGPLTILLPLPTASATKRNRYTLAAECTAGLSTFGCRLPASALSRTLISLADAPLAGPSANASTRPSPTTAQHVVDDLQGRIEYVLDGGSCGVGVESTVVDGLCDPPVILRPGGISEAQLRTAPGWEKVERAYHDKGKDGAKETEQQDAPRAPGMKYKHYSPKARVVLYEGVSGNDSEQQVASTSSLIDADKLVQAVRDEGLQEQEKNKAAHTTVAVIRTGTWPELDWLPLQARAAANSTTALTGNTFANGTATYILTEYIDNQETTVLDLDLGSDLPSIAHGLFYALRDMDARGADVILVEGIDDRGDDMASAVMNRLRKAASEIR